MGALIKIFWVCRGFTDMCIGDKCSGVGTVQVEPCLAQTSPLSGEVKAEHSELLQGELPVRYVICLLTCEVCKRLLEMLMLNARTINVSKCIR